MTAVVLLAHGSPDPRSSDATRALGAVLQGRSFETTVVVAFLQHNAPTLSDAVASLARRHSEAIVVPAFLSLASTREDARGRPPPRAPRESGSRRGSARSRRILLEALDRALPPGPAVLATAGTTDPTRCVRSTAWRRRGRPRAPRHRGPRLAGGSGRPQRCTCRREHRPGGGRRGVRAASACCLTASRRRPDRGWSAAALWRTRDGHAHRVARRRALRRAA
jgi:hypothetical protein